MVRSLNSWTIAAAVALAIACLPVPSLAEDTTPITNVVDSSQKAAAADNNKDNSSLSVIAIPVPVTNAAIGNGLGLAAGLIYKLDAGSPASYTGAGAFYTDKHSWAIGAAQKTNFARDRLHVNALAAYYNFHYDFFGIGEVAGSQGRSVPLLQSGTALIPEALVRVLPHTAIGIRYRYLTASTSVDLTAVSDNLHLSLPQAQLKITSSGLGPVVEYDSRNDPFSPSEGSYARIEADFAERALLTNTKSYSSVDGDYNGYRTIGKNSVIAYRASFCQVSNSTPFFDLCSFGSHNDLRGYTPGQYRDKTSFATQIEYRWRFWDPFGLVVFGGVGGVAPSFDEYRFDKLLPSGGGGLRYRASKKYPVNIGVDFAVGKRTTAFYVRIGEAF